MVSSTKGSSASTAFRPYKFAYSFAQPPQSLKHFISHQKVKTTFGTDYVRSIQLLIESMPDSKKRKLGDMASKYYAVRTGHRPGVYKNWAECKDNVTGFSGAQFKSFASRKEAEDFVAGKNFTTAASSKQDKFYAVAVGRRPGVYKTWEETSAEITKWPSPKYKRFGTLQEAEYYVNTGGGIPSKVGIEVTPQGAPTVACNDEPAQKRVKPNQTPVSQKEGNFLRVYTDGSSRGNGKTGAMAGVGVFFGEGDPRNVSEPLAGPLQTNQRSELTGLLRALEIVPKNQDVEIITDSSYSIYCTTTWYKKWQSNGWRTATGGPVLNKDLVSAIRTLMDERIANGAQTKFTWTKGHSNDIGNIFADRLAVAGAMANRARLES
ncbi:hypothetical protein B7463_g10210, partial [Scytalidium lignicola]